MKATQGGPEENERVMLASYADRFFATKAKRFIEDHRREIKAQGIRASWSSVSVGLVGALVSGRIPLKALGHKRGG